MYIFWSKVAIRGLDECWEWKASTFSNERAAFPAGRRLGLSSSASRTSHLLVRGPIPSGHHVLHSCDNPLCVNPLHLRSGNASTKLTPEQVEELGVSKGLISYIKNGHRRSNG